MAAELISALLDAVADEENDAEGFNIDAVKQLDNPAICLRQTVRFMRASSRLRRSTGNPDALWMLARCEACGVCRAGR